MDNALMIWIASKAADKNWDYETLKYCDDMYDDQDSIDDVWKYVKEYREIGTKMFNEKYKSFKLFP